MTIAQDRAAVTAPGARPPRTFLGGDQPRPDRRPVRRIDMRCGETCTTAGGRAGTAHARCQLLAGHDGAHALMYGGRDERVVVEWLDDDHPQRRREGWQGLAWMRGFPFPAWFEPTG